MIIKLYVYDVQSKRLMYEDSGSVEYIIYDLGDDKDFTLTPPPDGDRLWYWVDDKWQPEPLETTP